MEHRGGSEGAEEEIVMWINARNDPDREKGRNWFREWKKIKFGGGRKAAI